MLHLLRARSVLLDYLAYHISHQTLLLRPSFAWEKKTIEEKVSGWWDVLHDHDDSISFWLFCEIVEGYYIKPTAATRA